jgi:hypothetical protein
MHDDLGVEKAEKVNGRIAGPENHIQSNVTPS